MELYDDWDAKNLLVVFCVTCMKRDAQLIAAMTVNVSLVVAEEVLEASHRHIYQRRRCSRNVAGAFEVGH